MNTLKAKICRFLTKNDCCIFVASGNGGNFAWVREDKTRTDLTSTILTFCESSETLKNLILRVASEYLKTRESEKLKFSKTIYNTK